MRGRWVPWATAAAALGYTAMKLTLAARGELGLPGFPAPARPGVDPFGAQLGNAALGLLGAALAVGAARRWGPPLLLALALAAATLVEAAGAAVLVARVLRLVDGFGALPPGPGPALGAAYAVLTAALFVATTAQVARRAAAARAGPRAP